MLRSHGALLEPASRLVMAEPDELEPFAPVTPAFARVTALGPFSTRAVPATSFLGQGRPRLGALPFEQPVDILRVVNGLPPEPWTVFKDREAKLSRRLMELKNEVDASVMAATVRKAGSLANAHEVRQFMQDDLVSHLDDDSACTALFEAALRSPGGQTGPGLQAISKAVSQSELPMTTRIQLALMPKLNPRPATAQDPLFVMLSSLKQMSRVDLEDAFAMVYKQMQAQAGREAEPIKLYSTLIAAAGSLAETLPIDEQRGHAATWIRYQLDHLDDGIHRLRDKYDPSPPRFLELLDDGNYALRCANRNFLRETWHPNREAALNGIVVDSLPRMTREKFGSNAIVVLPAADAGRQMAELMSLCAMLFPMGRPEPVEAPPRLLNETVNDLLNESKRLPVAQMVDAFVGLYALRLIELSESDRSKLDDWTKPLPGLVGGQRLENFLNRIRAVHARATLTFEDQHIQPPG